MSLRAQLLRGTFPHAPRGRKPRCAIVCRFAHKATITRVSFEPAFLLLSSTIFHPQGGGQPSDTGQIKLAGGASTFSVSMCKVDRDLDDIVHEVGGDPRMRGEVSSAQVPAGRRSGGEDAAAGCERAIASEPRAPPKFFSPCIGGCVDPPWIRSGARHARARSTQRFASCGQCLTRPTGLGQGTFADPDSAKAEWAPGSCPPPACRTSHRPRFLPDL